MDRLKQNRWGGLFRQSKFVVSTVMCATFLLAIFSNAESNFAQFQPTQFQPNPAPNQPPQFQSPQPQLTEFPPNSAPQNFDRYPAPLNPHIVQAQAIGSPDPSAMMPNPAHQQDSERIAALQRTIESDQLALRDAQAFLSNPYSTYNQTRIEFEQLDNKIEDYKKFEQQAKEANNSIEASRLRSELDKMQVEWKNVKDRYDAASTERSRAQENEAALKQKLSQTQIALDQLVRSAQLAASQVQAVPMPNGMMQVPPGHQPVSPMTVPMQPNVVQIPTKPLATIPANRSSEILPVTPATLPVATTLEKAAINAETNSSSAGKSTASSAIELMSGKAPAPSKDSSSGSKADEKTTSESVKSDKKDAARAANPFSILTDIFTIENILKWFLDHGPRLVSIAIVMMIALIASRILCRRIVDIMVQAGGEAKKLERENRAKTLVGVFQNAIKVAIIGGGLLMMLDSVGIPVTALMGGAAVLGLAAAFGAQKLITDFFSGFMILLEQQYTINDVIKVGDVSGTVEHISLRMTMIRDLNGAVHFLPHGEISKITNLTHTWSRALFDITVPFSEDINAVIRAIEDVGREICADRKYAPDIMEGLTMLGVDALATANVTVRFFINTRPLKQWEIKREYLRRLKIAFDRLGIGAHAGAKATTIPAATANKPAITQKAA